MHTVALLCVCFHTKAATFVNNPKGSVTNVAAF